MNNPATIIPILIVNYNGRAYLEECLTSLASAEDTPRHIVYIVDNASKDDSVAYLRENWPDVRLILSGTNLGFAGGNNLGWQVIKREIHGVQYIMLLNQDTVVDRNFLRPLMTVLDAEPTVGAVQPLLLLHPARDRINSLGNVIHLLGFGYSSSNNAPVAGASLVRKQINYASGAAVLLRVRAIDRVGLFDDFMFMYLEDLDLGWRLSLAGWESMLVPDSIIYHKYEFRRGMRQYYYFERNRLWIIFKNYKLPTLLLLLPLAIGMEIGQVVRAAMTGTFMAKLRGYAYFFSVEHLKVFHRDRRAVQHGRIKTDREMLSAFSGHIDFQPLQGPLLRYIVNPVCETYLRILRLIVIW